MTNSYPTLAAGFAGAQGVVISVEARIRSGAPFLEINGLHHESVMETRDRVRAAVLNSGLRWPDHAVAVDVSRELTWQIGTAADVAIAVAFLGATGDTETPAGALFIGELGLDGSVRPVRGIVALLSAAAKAGIREAVIPEANLGELHADMGLSVYGVASLTEALTFRTSGRLPIPSASRLQTDAIAHVVEGLPNPVVCDALMVAAAGAHHAVLAGADSFRMNVAAAILSEFLPDLNDTEATEVSSLYSLAGSPRPAEEWFRPPLLALLPFAPIASVVGGGAKAVQPGAVSLAHHGVLYVSEAEELSPQVSDSVMACVDDQQVTLARAGGTVCLPSDFQLLLSYHRPPRKLTSLIDRCAIRARVSAEANTAIEDRQAGSQAFALLASRAVQARMAAGERWADFQISANARVPADILVRRPWRLSPAAVRELSALRDLGSITARGYAQVLQVAWTLADLSGKYSPGRDDVQAAIDLRHGGAS